MMLTQFAGLWPRGKDCKPESLYLQCGGSSKNFIVSNKKCYEVLQASSDFPVTGTKYIMLGVLQIEVKKDNT